MADINLLAASSIVLKSRRDTVEDDYAVTASSGGNISPINLGADQAAKVISLILRNTSSSTAYDIDVAVSENSAGNYAYLYENYSIAADTTWIAVSPNTTGPIFLEELDEFRIGGSTGAETYVYFTLSYELIT